MKTTTQGMADAEEVDEHEIVGKVKTYGMRDRWEGEEDTLLEIEMGLP